MEQSHLNFLLRVIEIIRPKFYNKLTWLVVAAGITMMSTSLVDKIISAFLEKSFQLNITGGNDVTWGFGLVAIGLIYHLSTTSIYELVDRQEKRTSRQKRIEHDKAIFAQANEIMSGEFLTDLILWIGNDHSYYLQDTRKIEQYCHYLSLDENQFLVGNLASTAEEFIRTSAKFLDFSAYKFFIFPNNQTGNNPRLCMVPTLNMDREGTGTPEEIERYDALTQELESLLDDLRDNYSSLRAEIKKALII